MSHSLDLPGIEGSNPLAMLCALGTVRTLSIADPELAVQLSWQRADGWRPQLHFARHIDEAEIVDMLHSRLAGAHDELQFTELGDDLTVCAEQFKIFARKSANVATIANRTAADFASAFGCEATVTANEEKPTIQDTAFRTMAGAGHQHFLGFMRNIIRETKPEHLRKSLFEPWRYDDSVTNLTLRWDPVDDVRYALRWQNPSGDRARRTSGSVLGANRLAIEGLPLFPTAPKSNGQLGTSGFRGNKSTNTFLTWPIWHDAINLDVIRSVLALPLLQATDDEYQKESSDSIRKKLLAMGVVEVYRSQRLTIGKVKNFTSGRSL